MDRGGCIFCPFLASVPTRAGRKAGVMMNLWLRCITGPKLQRIHRQPDPNRAEPNRTGPGPGLGGVRQLGWPYQPKALERHTSSILSWASILWSLSYYTSPLLMFYLYRKGYICLSKLVPVGQYTGTLLVLLLGVACLRGIGRWTNPEYVQFITILEETKKNNSPQNKGQSPGGVALLKPEPKHRGATDSVLNSVGKLPCQIISYLIANSFGRRMLYPGSVCLLQKAMMPMLNQGQARLVEECGGQRAKLVACDGNDIDTMFVDKRNSQGERGKKLGVPFPQNEANAMDVVVQYAIHKLGFEMKDIVIYAWSIGGFTANSFGRRMLYPGSVCLLQKAMMPMLNQGQARLVEECGGQRAKLVACDGNDIDTMFVDKRNSQGEKGKKLGVPFPQNEANAMDVVVQYAIHKLGFEMKDIVIYAWSIGGFTATWAAMSYPEVSALVLDASFDDLLPLALKVMPESWRPLVTRTVRHYMNLNNAEQLCKGPEDIMSNRGNYLLLRLLQFRCGNAKAKFCD
ncbi:UNVERIFIED_CONTAM: hypothetical protein FKN15_027972 [Acipenser sinensis]